MLGFSPFNLPQDIFASTLTRFGELPATALVSDSSCLALGHSRTRNSGLCSTGGRFKGCRLTWTAMAW